MALSTMKKANDIKANARVKIAEEVMKHISRVYETTGDALLEEEYEILEDAVLEVTARRIR